MQTRKIATREVKKDLPAVQLKEKDLYVSNDANPEFHLPDDEFKSEKELLEFCSDQIGKMKKHLRLGSKQDYPAFYEINIALMGYQNVYLALLTVYYTAKHELAEFKNIYDNWYAKLYTDIRNKENPKTLAGMKWISTKEIEFILRMKHTVELTEKFKELNLLEEKVGFMRRMLEGWKSHQFVLTQLSKNVQGESLGQAY